MEITGSNPNTSPAQKHNPWMIAIIVIILLCCFCVGVTGLLLAFGGDLLNELGITALMPSLSAGI